jgi:glutaminyl-peptide cyclotransferase
VKNNLALLFISFLLFACQNDKPKNDNGKQPEKVKVTAPKFNADNAYQHIEKQLAFGPRVPGTKAHDSCAAWLESKFKDFGATVIVQQAEVSGGSKMYNIKNIIATYNPSASYRILLCAHWDTRAIADQDSERKAEPIPGADDGGSGVGVLLEIARIINEHKLLNIGVDIVLFDAEDQGESGNNSRRDTWCLGAQYWSKNPHVPNYKANFGVLLDMVGARGASFPKEGVSMKHAAYYVDKIWTTAWEQGYNDFFINEEERQIIDDHLYINEIRKIPTVDIIYLSKDSPTGFGSHWHTHNDNIDIISKTTLNAVGQTLLQVLYEEDVLVK